MLAVKSLRTSDILLNNRNGQKCLPFANQRHHHLSSTLNVNLYMLVARLYHLLSYRCWRNVTDPLKTLLLLYLSREKLGGQR